MKIDQIIDSINEKTNVKKEHLYITIYILVGIIALLISWKIIEAILLNLIIFISGGIGFIIGGIIVYNFHDIIHEKLNTCSFKKE